jgi:hypothetical protein
MTVAKELLTLLRRCLVVVVGVVVVVLGLLRGLRLTSGRGVGRGSPHDDDDVLYGYEVTQCGDGGGGVTPSKKAKR